MITSSQRQVEDLIQQLMDAISKVDPERQQPNHDEILNFRSLIFTAINVKLSEGKCHLAQARSTIRLLRNAILKFPDIFATSRHGDVSMCDTSMIMSTQQVSSSSNFDTWVLWKLAILLKDTSYTKLHAEIVDLMFILVDTIARRGDNVHEENEDDNDDLENRVKEVVVSCVDIMSNSVSSLTPTTVTFLDHTITISSHEHSIITQNLFKFLALALPHHLQFMLDIIPSLFTVITNALGVDLDHNDALRVLAIVIPMSHLDVSILKIPLMRHLDTGCSNKGLVECLNVLNSSRCCDVDVDDAKAMQWSSGTHDLISFMNDNLPRIMERADKDIQLATLKLLLSHESSSDIEVVTNNIDEETTISVIDTAVNSDTSLQRVALDYLSTVHKSHHSHHPFNDETRRKRRKTDTLNACLIGYLNSNTSPNTNLSFLAILSHNLGLKDALVHISTSLPRSQDMEDTIRTITILALNDVMSMELLQSLMIPFMNLSPPIRVSPATKSDYHTTIGTQVSALKALSFIDKEFVRSVLGAKEWDTWILRVVKHLLSCELNHEERKSVEETILRLGCKISIPQDLLFTVDTQEVVCMLAGTLSHSTHVTIPCIKSQFACSICSSSNEGMQIDSCDANSAQRIKEYVKMCIAGSSSHSVSIINKALKHFSLSGDRNVINHGFSLEGSIGKYLLKVLFGTPKVMAVQERRIACNTLIQFVHNPSLPQDLTLQNTQILLQHLHSSVSSNDTTQQCNMIECMGSLGMVAQTDELVWIVLHSLLQSLTSKHMVLRTYASKQIVKIAVTRGNGHVTEDDDSRHDGWTANIDNQTRGQAILNLFQQYTKDIAILVAERLVTDTSLLREVVYLLNQTTTHYLRHTLEHTLPHLVVTKNTAALLKIAKLLRKSSVGELLIGEAHTVLASVFLMHQSSSEKQMVMHYFIKLVSNEKDNGGTVTLTNLLKSCSLALIIRLSLELGNENDKIREAARQALSVVRAKLCADENTSSSDLSGNVQGDDGQLSAFVKSYFLGILSHFNEWLADTSGWKTVQHKIQIVKALREIIIIIGSDICTMTHQVMATLETTLANLDLRESALQAWEAFIQTLSINNVSAVLHSSVVTLARASRTYTASQLLILQRILKYLFIKHGGALIPHCRDMDFLLLNLPETPDFNKIRSIISSTDAKKPVDVTVELRRLISGVEHENVTVCQEALKELVQVLLSRQKEVTEMFLDESVDVVLHDLILALLVTCRRFTCIEVQRLCCECLGIIGAVDPSRLSQLKTRDENRLVLLESFGGNKAVAVDFICELIENHLVKAFKNARSTRMQSHFSFTIQELLKLCGFTEDIVKGCDDSLQGKKRIMDKNKSRGESTVVNAEYLRRKWSKFSIDVAEAIRPLLVSKYSLSSTAKSKPADYPIYPTTASFEEWLRSWVTDLIDQVSEDENAGPIFGVCRAVVKSGDIHIAMFLLPHLVVNVLLLSGKKTEVARMNLLTEILAALSTAESPKLVSESVSDAGNNQNDENSEYSMSISAHQTESVDGVKSQLASQTIFSLFDHLTEWVRLKKQKLAVQKAAVARAQQKGGINKESTAALEEMSRDVKILEDFLVQIPQKVMATASFQTKAYARALMHFELHLRQTATEETLLPGVNGGSIHVANEKDRTRSRSKNRFGSTSPDTFGQSSNDEVQTLYGYIQNIYAQLDEPDGMEGISALFRTPTIDQQILEHESCGNWAAAQTCYELNLQRDPNSLSNHLGLFNCLRNVGHIETLLSQIKGVCVTHSEWAEELRSYAIEATWRLGKWEDLSKELEQPCNKRKSFEITLGKILLAARQGNQSRLLMEIQSARDEVTTTLAAASMESYRRCYDHILQLHMLHEIEMAFQVFQSNTAHSSVAQLSELWNSRLQIVVPSFKVTEPLLNMRRLLITDLKGPDASVMTEKARDHECGRLWLQSAKLSRKAKFLETSYGALLNAQLLKADAAHIERAKWLWIQGHPHKAIAELQNAADQLRKEAASNKMLSDADTRRIISKTELTLAKWLHETSGSATNSILERYAAVVKDQPDWEKAHYLFGRMYCQLLESQQSELQVARTRSGLTKVAQCIGFICREYAKALQHGTKYIYQTLPRLLTLWFDFSKLTGLDLEDPSMRSSDDERSRVLLQVNKILKKCHTLMPAYVFLASFPQIVSRICHKDKNIFAVLESIIIQVLSMYPHQALWQMISTNNSTYRPRASRCQTIFTKVKSDPTIRATIPGGVENIVNDMTKLSGLLLDLCNHNVPQPGVNFLSISTDIRTLHRMAPVKVIIPLQSSMTVTLPSTPGLPTIHRPFPVDPPMIAKFYDEVEIMKSLARPKKITILGTDGKDYIFLCKPKDDLRKDCRLMEFNSMINKFLKKDPDARRRNLHIRTYAVTPLNEDCGLIEWVPNTVGLRHILLKYYKARGILMSNGELKAVYAASSPSPQEKFLKLLRPRFPPVLYEWFLETFPEPTRWFFSRLSYASTAAVMSMVGYVLGLGDRHGENILFDDRTGDVVHVDFNCLFEKGLTFEKPEKVPFRLTHNMVDAFGVTGVEGPFRKCCEVTMRILRHNRESLMSVLETFMHDPLVEWTKHMKNEREKSGEIENQNAVRSLTQINRKLQGTVSAGLPLSVEGQVHELISQATDIDNLAVMYIGWASFQ